MNVNRADQNAGMQAMKQAAVEKAAASSERIGQAVRWQDIALSSRGSASQIVSLAARGPNVIGVAVLDAQGGILSNYPAQAKSLNVVSIENFPEGGVRIEGLPGEGGSVSPLIIRNSGDIYLVTQYAPGSFLGEVNGADTVAIISRSGQIIDGSQRVNANGVTAAFSLNDRSLGRLTSVEKGVATQRASGNTHIAALRVPNSDLTFMRNMGQATIGTPAPTLPFILLFVMTTLMVGFLLRNLNNRLKSEEEAHSDTHRSQERFRQAVDSGRGGIFEIDTESQSIFLNEQLAENFGMPRQETYLTMSQFLGLVHEDDRERFLSASRRAPLNGTLDIEIQAARLSSVFQFRGKINTVTGESIRSVISGIAGDITEQRAAKLRLQMAEARLYDALHTMTNSFVIWNRSRKLMLWNGKFEDFFGFAPGQLQMGMDQDIVEQMAYEQIDNIYRNEDNPGETDDIIEIHLKDGRWIRYAEAVTADGGQVSIGNDVTEIRSREQQLRENDTALRNTVDVLRKSQTRIMELADNYEQEKIRAEEANQSKSDFLANMSHELRTPLNAINGFSDIMKREMFGPLGDPRYKEYVNDILFSGQHLLSLINDILDMSKIEAGKMTLNTDRLRISDMISQVLRIVRGRAEDGKLKLQFDTKKVKEVEADPRAVKQVLLNLITNAIKFTPEGGTVKIDVEENSAGLIVKVIDSGIGIAQEDIDRLGNPFEQVDKAASTQTEGTGLGLALSKAMIELHGGNFVITSVLGEGTTVTFTLPNTPPVKEEKPKGDNEVGDEITRLAADIADVLGQSTETPPEPPVPMPAAAATPQPMSAPAAQQAMPAPQPMAAPTAQAAPSPQPAPPPAPMANTG